MDGLKSSRSSPTMTISPNSREEVKGKMKKNVMIIGAGGVAHVAAHKCAQNNDILGDICIASRRVEKCDKIIESIKRKNNIKDKTKKIYSRQIDAKDVDALTKLIEETKTSIVINLGSAFVN